MKIVVNLGYQLVKAGGRWRFTAIAISIAISTLLLLGAASLPNAMTTTSGDTEFARKMTGWIVVLVVLVPTLVLLLTVTRLSAEVRDRRLTSLRLIGAPLGRVRLIGAFEGSLPATCGALIGIITFFVISPSVSHLMIARNWISQPLNAPIAIIVSVGVIVVGISGLLGAATTPRNPISARVCAPPIATGTPRWWRPIPLGIGLIMLAFVPTSPVNLLGTSAPQRQATFLLTGGAAISILGVVLVAPALSRLLGSLIGRSSIPIVKLTGRGMAADRSSGRLLATITLASFVTALAAGQLTLTEATPENQAPIQASGKGPQAVLLLQNANKGSTDSGHIQSDSERSGAPFSQQFGAALARINGLTSVHRILLMTGWSAKYATKNTRTQQYPVFVGTCEDLTAVATVAGCDDTQAAWFARQRNIDPQLNTAAESLDSIDLLDQNDPTKTSLSIPTGKPIKLWDQAPRANNLNLLGDRTVAFVPEKVLREASGESSFLSTAAYVIADGGTKSIEEINRQLRKEDHIIAYERFGENDVNGRTATRLVIYTLCGIILSIGIVSFTISAIDRIRSRRRLLAHQVALGVSHRIMMASQSGQLFLPLFFSFAAALGCTLAIGGAAMRFLPDLIPYFPSQILLTLTAAAAAVTVLIGLLGWLSCHFRLTATLLREE